MTVSAICLTRATSANTIRLCCANRKRSLRSSFTRRAAKSVPDRPSACRLRPDGRIPICYSIRPPILHLLLPDRTTLPLSGLTSAGRKMAACRLTAGRFRLGNQQRPNSIRWLPKPVPDWIRVKIVEVEVEVEWRCRACPSRFIAGRWKIKSRAWRFGARPASIWRADRPKMAVRWSDPLAFSIPIHRR